MALPALATAADMCERLVTAEKSAQAVANIEDTLEALPVRSGTPSRCLTAHGM